MSVKVEKNKTDKRTKKKPSLQRPRKTINIGYREGEFEPVGSSTTHKVDVRIVAATNRNLNEAIRNFRFREDLYYRIHVFPIEMPPLRERGDDVILLAEKFATIATQKMGKQIAPLTPDCKRRLKAYSWPGNVRELQDIMERAVITARNGQLNLEECLPHSGSSLPELIASTELEEVLTAAEMENLERQNFIHALNRCEWRISGPQGAAKLRIRNQWIDCGHNRSEVRDFYGACQDINHAAKFVLDADEPEILLGQEKGASPVEYLLHALAACVTTAMVYHAAAKGIEIEEVESYIDGDIDLQGFLGLRQDVRRGFEAIRMRFKIKADVSDEQLEEIVKLGPHYFQRSALRGRDRVTCVGRDAAAWHRDDSDSRIDGDCLQPGCESIQRRRVGRQSGDPFTPAQDGPSSICYRRPWRDSL